MAFENDPRTWSFAKRALAELKKPRKRQTKKFWRCWFQVQLADWELRWYQLPKDLQAAIKAERKLHPQTWQNFLQGAVINVPIGEYHDGKAPITCGLICQVKMRHHQKVPSHDVTRSQFVQPTYLCGWPRYHQLANYLKHDFSPENQYQIKHDLHRVLKPKWWLKRKLGGI